MKRILAIDTVSECCSAAVWVDGHVYQEKEVVGTGHSRCILDMVDRVMANAELHLDQLDCVAVDTGPGSFTGVRIGLGVAQGLAFGAGVPAIGIGSLEVLASMAGRGRILPAIDARMNQVYCALYEVGKGNGRPVCLEQPTVTDPDQLPFNIQGLDAGVGSGWGQYPALLDNMEGYPSGQGTEISPDMRPEAKHVSHLAALSETGALMEASSLVATYVRDKVAEKPASKAR